MCACVQISDLGRVRDRGLQLVKWTQGPVWIHVEDVWLVSRMKTSTIALEAMLAV